jgi:hypothetical protein
MLGQCSSKVACFDCFHPKFVVDKIGKIYKLNKKLKNENEQKMRMFSQFSLKLLQAPKELALMDI